MFARNLALAVKNSEITAEDREKVADITQSQDVTTADVHCLRQVRPASVLQMLVVAAVASIKTVYNSQAVQSSQCSKKVKFSHTRYRALGPELIPVYRQSARR